VSTIEPVDATAQPATETTRPKSVSELTVPELADEFGELSRRLELAKSDEARLKLVAIRLKPLFEDTPDDEPTTLDGCQYQLRVTPRENETKITDITAVRKAMSAAEFLEIATVTLKALKAAVSESKFLSLVTTARTGNRTIKAVRKSA
jgi:hypothetical protein